MLLEILTVSLALWGSENVPALSWRNAYKEALAEAKRDDKPLFILFDGGTSTVVKRLNDQPKLNDHIERELADGYVVLFVDTGTEMGQKLAKAYGATELPYTVLLDRSGEWQVYRRSGNPPIPELTSVLARHRRTKHGPSSTVTVNTAERPQAAAESASVRPMVRIESPNYSWGQSAAWCRT